MEGAERTPSLRKGRVECRQGRPQGCRGLHRLPGGSVLRRLRRTRTASRCGHPIAQLRHTQCPRPDALRRISWQWRRSISMRPTSDLILVFSCGKPVLTIARVRLAGAGWRQIARDPANWACDVPPNKRPGDGHRSVGRRQPVLRSLASKIATAPRLAIWTCSAIGSEDHAVSSATRESQSSLVGVELSWPYLSIKIATVPLAP